MKNNKGKKIPEQSITLTAQHYVVIGAGKEGRIVDFLDYYTKIADLAIAYQTASEHIKIRSAIMRIEAWRADETGGNFSFTPLLVTCPTETGSITGDYDINSSLDGTDTIQSKIAGLTTYFDVKKLGTKHGSIFGTLGNTAEDFTQAFRLKTAINLTSAMRKWCESYSKAHQSGNNTYDFRILAMVAGGPGNAVFSYALDIDYDVESQPRTFL